MKPLRINDNQIIPTYTQLATIKEPAHGTLVPIAYAQKPRFNTHADVPSRARGLKFGLSLHLHPYFMFSSSKGSGESAHWCRLA